jgi:hypothetical protein
MKSLKKLTKDEMRRIKGGENKCYADCADEGTSCLISNGATRPTQTGICTRYTCYNGTLYWRCA